MASARDPRKQPKKEPEHQPQPGNERAEEMEERALERAQDAAFRAYESAWAKAREGIESMTGHPGESLEQVGQRMWDAARSTIGEQKERAADGLHRVSKAILYAAQKLRDEGDASLSEYAALLAGQVNHAAGYLKARESSALVADAEGFVRKQAVLFMGGMFATGFIVARMMQGAPSPPPTESESTKASAAGPQEIPDMHKPAAKSEPPVAKPSPQPKPPPARGGEKKGRCIPPDASGRFTMPPDADEP
jgi:hypothetical protein